MSPEKQRIAIAEAFLKTINKWETNNTATDLTPRPCVVEVK